MTEKESILDRLQWELLDTPRGGMVVDLESLGKLVYRGGVLVLESEDCQELESIVVEDGDVGGTIRRNKERIEGALNNGRNKDSIS